MRSAVSLVGCQAEPIARPRLAPCWDQPTIAKLPRTTFEIGLSLSVRSGGAVPLTASTVNCAPTPLAEEAHHQLLELKLTSALPQPTCWIHTFWTPSMSGARSFWDTIICAVKDSSLPSPAR